MNDRKLANILFSWMMLFAVAASGQSAFKLREVVRTDNPAPVPAQLSSVDQFAFNNQSQIAFAADGGLFLQSGGSTSIVAVLDDHAPGGGTFVSVSGFSLNSKGQVAFRGNIKSPTSFGGLYLSSQGKLKLLIADGTVATSGNSVVPDNPAINDAGAIAFVDLISGGLFLDSAGTVSPLVRSGDPAPGGDVFLQTSSPAINNSGQVVFLATLASGNQGVFLATGQAISKIIATGDLFPDGAAFFAVQGTPSINDGGAVAFAGFINGGSVLDEGLYLFSGGSLQVVVPTFTPIASLAGALLLPQSASINNAGQIAFISQEIGQPGFGLSVFLFSGGNVSVIMSPGQASPDGDVFSGSFNPQINASGQVGFISRLTQHNDALYVSSGNQVARIAGQGDSVARQPRFAFPFAFGLSNQKQALAFDQTFPGGIGLFSAGPHHGDVTLDAHVGQTIGNDGAIEDFGENFPMNGQGQVVMNADLSSGISSIMISSTGGPIELVRASFSGNGDPSPSGGTFLGVRESSINNLGQVLFSGFDTLASGLYLISNGQVTLAVSDNTPIPGGGGGIFGTTSLNSINNQGDIAFLAQAFPEPNGMFLLSNGQFSSIARAGDPAPGGGAFTLGFPDPRFGPAVSNNGDVVFADDLSIGGRGVFLFSKGTLTRLVGPGDPSPDGSTFLSADAPTINSSGQVAFSGVTVANGPGAFIASGGMVAKVAVPGDTVGKNSFTFVDLPQINDLGDVAFGADLSNGDTAVFIARSLEDQDGDPDDITPVSGAGLFASQVPLSVMKGKHPHNFAVHKRSKKPNTVSSDGQM